MAASLSVSAHGDTLKAGLGELDYPPFYFEKNGSLTGAAIEIAEAVSKRAGYQLDYQRVPWMRLQNMLKMGSLDMVTLYFKTKERARDVIYTGQPHIYENSSAVIPKGLNVAYNGNIHSLANFDLFYVRGYSHGAEFDSSKTLAKHTVNNESELLKRITSSRPFIGIGNKPALLMYAKKLGLQDKIEFLEPPFDQGKNYMAFSKKMADAQIVAAQFSAAFSEFSKTKAYKEILVKYGFSSH